MANLEFRKKAMNKMMMDKPSLSVMKKKKPMEMEALEIPDGIMNKMQGNGEEESEGEFVSMMVTPEEKALIEKLRAKDGGEGPESMDGPESDME